MLICKVAANHATRKRRTGVVLLFSLTKSLVRNIPIYRCNRYDFIQQFNKIRIRKIHYIIITLSE